MEWRSIATAAPTRGSSTVAGAPAAACTASSRRRGGTRATVSTESTMATGSRPGRGEAGTGGNTTRACGTGSGCICSIAGTATSASEPAHRVTGSACRDAPTAVATLGISRPASSMASAATISGLVTSILESILVIRYMVLESIALLMVTFMKVHGMRARNNVLDYTHSGLARQDQAIGIVEL